MKKRYVCGILAVLMCFSLLVGCSSDKETDKTSSVFNKEEAFIFDASKHMTLCKDFDYKLSFKDEAALQSAIDDYLEQYGNPTYEQLTGTVKEGDLVNIDYVGKKDGVAFDGGTAQGYNLGIGTDSFIDGFEDGLIGVKTGKTVDLNLTFPENYGTADLAGAKVVFTVTVNYICGEPSYTDKELQDAKERVICNDLYTSIMKQSEYRSIPTALHDYYYNMVISYYGSTASGVTEYAEQYAQQQGKFVVLVRALADEFKLTVTDKDYTGMLNALAAEYNTTPAKFEEENGKAFLRFQALSELVQEDLYKRYEATLEK